MKGLAHLTLAASLVAGVAEAQHGHQHRHFHARRQAGTPVERRSPDIITQYVQGPVVTQYELEGKPVDLDKAKAGIKDGMYSVVGETEPVFTQPPAAPKPSTTTQAAIFVEQKSSSSSSTSSAAPTTSTAAPSATASLAKGIDADFPSGKIPCSSLPTDYGATPLSWLGINGWASIMQPDEKKWTPGRLIATLHQTVSGGCTANSFCSYACPNGYQKTQWPESSQGATGQSVGGLWCNADGMLELTRPEHPKLCEKGAGGVYIQNKLPGKSCVCRTDYPGNEKMSIPIETLSGQKYEVMNPDAKTSYWWKGAPTSAQYYINKLNVDVEDACVWDSPKYPDSAGNWAPTNLGVGKDIYGITYISIFKNLPTSTADLDFDIEIVGDVTSKCALKNGQYTGGGNGCTTAISKPGGTATIVFSKGS